MFICGGGPLVPDTTSDCPRPRRAHPATGRLRRPLRVGRGDAAGWGEAASLSRLRAARGVDGPGAAGEVAVTKGQP